MAVCSIRCIYSNKDYLKNIKYAPLLQQKIERGKNIIRLLKICKNAENMANEIHYTRRENRYF